MIPKAKSRDAGAALYRCNILQSLDGEQRGPRGRAYGGQRAGLIDSVNTEEPLRDLGAKETYFITQQMKKAVTHQAMNRTHASSARTQCKSFIEMWQHGGTSACSL